MSSLVVDSSILVEVLTKGDRAGSAALALRGSTLTAPAHLDAEVLSALARLNRAGAVGESDVEAWLFALGRLPVVRYPCVPLLRGAWAMRHSVAMRDALYVELARRLGSRLLTLDGRLARGAANAGVDIRLITV